MLFIRVVFLILIASFSPPAETFLVVQEKRITVRGNTSVGSFNCKYEISRKSDTLFLLPLGWAKTYHFNIPTEVFQCGNFLLNKDFRKTLKANEFPHISVYVNNIQQNYKGDILGSLQLVIAGKMKNMGKVNFNRIQHENSEILSTDIKLLVSDFDIQPPKRFGGLVRTDDVMYIEVDLILE